MANQFTYEIVENLGILSTSNAGWTREVNLISWNGKEAKVDIRDWSPDKSKMGKGISFTTDELLALKELLNSQE